MAETVAIVAHFDAQGGVAAHVIEMLECVASVFDRVLLVSTSPVGAARARLPANAESIERPNIGYDFYSYRVGLAAIGDADVVLLANTSIAVLDPVIFAAALRRLVEAAREGGAVAVTRSRQFAEHLQSYMLALGRPVLESSWFQEFVGDIEPLGDKMQVVQLYEIGLSTLLAEHGVNLNALFSASADKENAAQAAWNRWRRDNGSLLQTLRARPWATADQYNPIQFHAREVAERFGFIKIEVLRDNPHGRDLEFVRRLMSTHSAARLNEVLDRSKDDYRAATLGKLATVAPDPAAIPTAIYATYGTPHAPGIRLAVVVHVYFPEVLEEMLPGLETIVEPFDLYLTTPHEALIAPLLRRCAPLAHSVTEALVENRGRDIAPFVRLLRDGLFGGYLAVLKLHSKKSGYSAQGDAWRRSLVAELIGDSLKVRRAVALFETGNVGLVGPHGDYLSHDTFWGSNRERVAALLATADNPAGDARETPLGFFAGSMFWFAPEALADLSQVPDDRLAFEPEAGQQDGTVAHALERVFAPLSRRRGFMVTTLPLKGAEIAGIDTSGNRIPVL